MIDALMLLWCALTRFFRSKARLEAEILVLHQQINVLRRKSPTRPWFVNIDRLLFIWLSRRFPSTLDALTIVRPPSPRPPWQNAYAERLIGTLRRDCLDHVLIFDARLLRQILTSYSSYYNQTRTHLSPDKDASLCRAGQRYGIIVATPILPGLHHRYARI